MLASRRSRIVSASLRLLALSPIAAKGDAPKPEPRVPWVDLLAAARSGRS